MSKSELQKLLISISKIEDRLLKLRNKFEENEDYQFGDGSNGSTLYQLISVAVAAVGEVYECSDEDADNLVKVYREF